MRDFDFDAAILFSDLLFPLEALGFGLSYDDGPPRLDGSLTFDRVAHFRPLPDALERLRFQGEAMHATRAAVEEGILPGGGVALLRATKVLEKLKVQNDDQKVGVEIVRKAISAPARQIALNAGEDGSVIVGKILEKDQYGYGFDAQTGEYVNMMSKGIIDPTKVVRAALQGAASVAAEEIGWGQE